MLRLFFAFLFGLLFSQFPNFSQQYVQRLGGAAEELSAVITQFDQAAEDAWLSREEALESMDSNEFLENHQGDMRATIKRGERLIADYETLQPLNDIGRMAHIYRFRDWQITSGTAGDFRPAIPLTFSGLIITFIGMLIGYLLSWPIFRLFSRKEVNGRYA